MTATEPVEQTGAEPERPERRTVLASAAFGGLMLVAAVCVVVDAVRLPETSGVVGPAAVPLPIGVLLGAVGATLVVRARLQLRDAAPGETRPAHGGLRVAAMVATLVAFAVLLPVLGYVVSSAALFAVTAILLGAPRPAQMIAYGWALSALVFLTFDRLIGLTLPTGPWGF
ncbi:tripartite tricarboxylate transporter TctB family protein [Prauserella cavernicola]|uniref:Tripartite tricarboxylate transporter TctB family protein n=1 Tax=Prauserella cavernicola TaxID=2800127 RepID=A0A934QMU9_9PSEU|nr:tripartite tricarboxylate transporter TctB family protein [Prauserella cavernicola]MBK1783335.1 tripartite tricarboxylate transporter TctB family protein [Prauserella cavernicola]